MQTKQCLVCGRTFEKPYRCGIPEWTCRRKFCCRTCANEWKKGKCFSPDTQFSKERHFIPITAIKSGQHLSKRTEFKKGHQTWNKGSHGLMPVPWNKGKNHLAGESNPAWKGDRVSYVALHHWVYRRLGRANHCEMCGILGKEKYHWANISGEYKRDTTDYMQLCALCHKKYDRSKPPQKRFIFSNGKISMACKGGSKKKRK